MAAIIQEVLNAAGMSVTLACAGQAKAGLGLTGTWTGTVSFSGSFDGLNFVPLTMTPFASGTGVQSATANGSWEVNVRNYVAIKATFTTLTTGTVTVKMAASNDSSYQDAFLAASSEFLSQNVAAGATNVITVAAQANRAWRCRSLTVGFSIAPAAAVDIKITDGASTVIWEGFVPKSDVSATGFTYTVPLPAPDPNVQNVATGGVRGTPGNSMVITLAAPGGSVVSTVNAEMIAGP